MTLVEMLVALVVAGLILSAGAVGLMGAIGGLDYARENREAADLLTEVIEGARAADHAAVAVRADAAGQAELAADPNLTGSGGLRWLDPDGTGPLGAEEVLSSPTGAITLRRKLVRDGTPYTVRTYVTEPAGAIGSMRRVVAVVSWQRAAAVHTRRAATVVALTRRGLPLPRFTVEGASVLTVNQGAALVAPLVIANRGYRDRWTLVASAPGRAWHVDWYRDDDANGLHEAGETTLMGDTNGDGAVDTGLLDTDDVLRLVAVATVDAYDVPGHTTLTLTATPVSQPESGSKSIAHDVTVVSQACSGCTYVPYFLANDEAGSAISSPIVAEMELLDVVGPVVGLPNYDTDKNLDAGRTLAAGGTPTGTDMTKVAIWGRQMAEATTLAGTALVRLYVAAKDLNPSTIAQLRVDVGHVHQNGTGWTVLGAATTVPVSFGSGFAVVGLAIPVNAVVPRNRYLQLRLTAPTASAPLWLGYGTSGHPAVLQIPVVT
jgi:type II secretory pathway pseudopilin PulG